MHSEQIAIAVRALLEKTGVGRQLADEAEAARKASFASLQKRKAASLATFLKNRPGAEARVESAEAKQRASQTLAEDALQDYIKAREALDTVIGTHQNDLNAIHPDMLKHADPQIAAFRVELLALQENMHSLYRSSRDAKGNSADNTAQIDLRVRRIHSALDELTRVALSHEIADFGAEISALRTAIPEA